MAAQRTVQLTPDILAVRVTNLQHIRTLRSLTYTIWRAHFPGVISVEQIEYMLRKFYGTWNIVKKLWRGERFYLVKSGGKYVGYFSYSFEPDSKRVQLNKFFLLKDMRGKGIARAAADHMLQIAKDHGAKVMWLAINRKNKDSIAAWEHLGFKIVREEAFDIGHGFVMDDYIMEKPL